MSKKVSLQDILNGLVARSDIRKSDAQQFLKELQSVIDEGLERDGIVKIGGFGTFKLIWIAPRKSVNVQTGESIELPGHNKLTFLPDASVRDLVNAPLSYLEVVTLDEALNPPAEVSNTVEQMPDSPLTRLSHEAESLHALIDSIQTGSPSDPVVGHENSHIGELQSRPAVWQTDVPVAQVPMEEKQIEPASGENSSVQAEDSLKTAILPSEGFERSSEELPNKQMQTEEQTVLSGSKMAQTVETPVTSTDTSRKNRWWPYALVLLVLLLGTIGYLMMCTPFFGDFCSTKQLPIADTASLSSSDSLVEPASLDTMPVEAVDIYSEPRVYTSFIDTTILTNGSRLTLLALKYYGHRNFWVYIYEANRDKIENPNKISVGTKLLIPQLNPDLVDPCKPKSLEYALELEKHYLGK